MKKFIKNIPKAELHVHFDGAISPEMIFAIARRNGVGLPFNSLQELKYYYDNLDKSTFFKIFPIISTVLKTEQDFYDVLMFYFQKAYEQNIKHAEIFFDTQSFSALGTSVDTVINGLYKATQDAKSTLNISSFLILCFLRQLPQSDAIANFNACLKHKDKIKIIGLAGPEEGNPATKFIDLFTMAKKQGFKLTAHAGEGVGVEYVQNIRDSINLLHVDRIDHGIACLDDHDLMLELAQKNIPLTVCPLSNIKLGIYNSASDHNIKKMLEIGLLISINSDDPELFKSNLEDNFQALAEECSFAKHDLIKCAKNSFKSSFLDEKQKLHFITLLKEKI